MDESEQDAIAREHMGLALAFMEAQGQSTTQHPDAEGEERDLQVLVAVDIINEPGGALKLIDGLHGLLRLFAIVVVPEDDTLTPDDVLNAFLDTARGIVFSP